MKTLTLFNLNPSYKTLPKALTLVCLFTVLAAPMAMAKDSRTLNGNYPYEGNTITLDVKVGQTQVIASDEQDVRVEVEIEANKKGWFSWGTVDLSAVTLQAQTSDNNLTLSLDDQDDLTQTWTVYVPSSAKVKINLGVGEVVTQGLESSLDIALGVGSVQVAHQHQYRHVELDSGVGEVSVYLGQQSQSVQHNLVSQSYDKSFDGEGELTVSVGVGEVSVRQAN